MSNIKNPLPEVPLAQHRIGRYLCEDIAAGRPCPHHQTMAERLYFIVIRAQDEEREKNRDAALERIAGFVENLVPRT